MQHCVMLLQDYCRLWQHDTMLAAVHRAGQSIWCLPAVCASWLDTQCNCNDTRGAPAAAALLHWLFFSGLDHCAKGMSQLATPSLLAFQAMGSGGTARQPETGKGKDAPQYFGTVVYDPSSASNLPVLEW